MAIRDWNPFTTPKQPDSGAVLNAIADLERLGADRPELADAGRTLGKILRAAFSEPVVEVHFEIEDELLVSAWNRGIPAFHVGETAPKLDAADAKARGLAVLDVLRGENPDAKSMSKSIRDGTLDLSDWANEVLRDPSFPIDARANSLGIDAMQARSVLRLVMLPALVGVSRRLATIRDGSSWTGGECPNCGSPPTLAESRGLEQRRHWRCGLCAADWQGERLRCPFCAETDHRKLSFLAVEGEQDRYRVSVCDSCGGRLKVTATLGTISAPGLLVAELAMAHLEGATAEIVPH